MDETATPNTLLILVKVSPLLMTYTEELVFVFLFLDVTEVAILIVCPIFNLDGSTVLFSSCRAGTETPNALPILVKVSPLLMTYTEELVSVLFIFRCN